MWFALRASYLVAVVLCNIKQSLEDEDTKRSFLARRAIDGSRGRKYYEAKDDGFFEDYSFNRGHYDARDRSGPPDIKSNIPGESGVDYPTYERLPQTSFSCEGRDRGYYADDEAGCQMFHVCDNILVSSFLCPVGSLFSQKLLTCDWWNKVDCSTTRKFYEMNRNLYQQDDGDEMIRKAFVMIHLHPDMGLITEPEERERQGKIIPLSRMDTRENDLPNNYDDSTNDSELHQSFDDYSNQLKDKLNPQINNQYNDHVLYSQEYQTHAPKIYPDSRLVRIHKINNAYYENRPATNGKKSSYRLPANEFVNEFQPAYAPTVPTVTTTTRRYYSPTVPMSYRSSTLAYDKFDQNFDSSIHLYEHGKNGLSTTTPATVYHSANFKNSTRGLHKFRGSSRFGKEEARRRNNFDRKEPVEESVGKINYREEKEKEGVKIDYNGQATKEETVRRENYNIEEDYVEREPYDRFYDEEFEIMEGRESIGLGRSSSERLEEGTTLSSVLENDTNYRVSSPIENNTTFVNFDNSTNAASETFENGKEELPDKSQDYSAFTEATNFEQVYPYSDKELESGGDLKVKEEETFEHKNESEEEEEEKKKGEEEKEDLSSKVEDYSLEREEHLRNHQDNPQRRQDFSKEHQNQSKHQQFIPELSTVLQPPHHVYKSFQNDDEDHIPSVQRDTQPTRVPIPYQHYSNYEEKHDQSNSTEILFRENPESSFHDVPENSENVSQELPEEVTHENFKDTDQENSEDLTEENIDDVTHEYTDDISQENPKDVAQENRYQESSENKFQENSYQEKTTEDKTSERNSSNPESSTDHQENIPPPSINPELPNYDHKNINYEEQVLRKYNPDLDFTIRSAIWNQQFSSQDQENLENPFLNHRPISLDLEPPNEDPPVKFQDPVIPPSINSKISQDNHQNKDHSRLIASDQTTSSRNAKTQTTNSKSQKRRFQVTSTAKPDYPASISEIEDTIEESNTPYQVSLSVSGDTKSSILENGFIGTLIKQHEKDQDLTDFENVEIIKSKDPALLGIHEEPSIVYTKQESSITNYPSLVDKSETHNRTEKSAEIQNQDAEIQRMRILQLMSELAKTNRVPRPFSSQKDEITNSNQTKSINETNREQQPVVSSTETTFLRKEEILEQLARSFGQPLYGSRKEEDRELLFELPDVKRITDFRTGKAIGSEESDSTFINVTSSTLDSSKEENNNYQEYIQENSEENVKESSEYNNQENNEDNNNKNDEDNQENNENNNRENREYNIEGNNQHNAQRNLEENKKEAKELNNNEETDQEDNYENDKQPNERYNQENEEADNKEYKEVNNKNNNNDYDEVTDTENIKESEKKYYGENGKETGSRVVEMEFLPSIGFSFDTHEGREEYAHAVLQGLVTEQSVIKSGGKFSSRSESFDSTESTKNFEKST